ncbi:MAG: histidine kinase [Actinomycetota bacterium]
MTSTPVLIWDEQRRLQVAAAAAVVGAVVAMGASDFEVLDSILLPIVAGAFVAKALRPGLPNLLVAVPAIVVPLTINIVNETEDEFSMFLLVLAIALVASIDDNRIIANGTAAVSVVLIFVLSIVEVYRWAWVNWLAAIALSWGFGTAVYHYDRVLAELRATQVELIDHAAQVERRRIARDVHDLVGHSLSVVMLHVAGARRLLRSDPDEAEVALRQAEEAGRTSMAEVRRTVGLLRADGDAEGSAPTPDLSDIAEVVEQYRLAGMDVEHRVDGPADEVEGPLAVACHRIVQEALANVSKHTVGARVLVTVDVDRSRCQVEIRNEGGEALPATASAFETPGHGLVGMRERALSVGGSLLAGPIDNGWSVEVVVPRTAAVDR